METLRHIVLFIHLVGFATLFGAWAVEAFGGRRELTRLMNIGLAIAGVAGLILAAPWGLAEGATMNYPKVGTKLIVLVIIGALIGIGSARQKRGEGVPAPMFWGVGVLTLVNAGLAVLW